MLPVNNTEQLIWNSSNDDVATITDAGEITAKAYGTATITVSSFDGSVVANCEVSVQTPATSVSVEPKEKALVVGESLALSAVLAPETAVDSFTWTIDNDSLASLKRTNSEEYSGNKDTATVTALKKGKVTITVTSVSTGKSNKCTISIKEPVVPTLSPTPKPKATVLPTATVKPSPTAASASTTLTKPATPKVTRGGAKKLKVRWKSVSGATGYQVQYGLKSNFKGAKKKNTTKTVLTLSKLKKKKNYYIRIRAYQIVDGKKVYSAWSGKKKSKVKK